MTPIPPRARSWLTVLEAAVLAALPLLLLRGFEHAVDLHIQDEVHYLRSGRAFVHGDVSGFRFAWCPLFSLAYGLLDLATPGGVLAPDVMLRLVGVASVLALWWCARALLPAPAAFLVAAWWAGSGVLLDQGLEMARPTVYAFHLAGFLAAAGAVARGTLGPALGLLVLLWLVRVETGLVVLGLGAGLFFVPARRRAAWVFLAVGGVLVGAALYSGDVRARAWTTFRQHYAHAAWEREGGVEPRGVDAFEQPERWVEGEFPRAWSVGSALRANPAAFARFLLDSAARLPAELARLVGWSYAHIGWLRWPLVAGALVLAAAGAARGRERFAGSAEAWCALASGLLVLPAALLALARAEVMMTAAPFVLIGVASLAVAGFRALRLPPVPAARAILPPAVLVLVAAGPAAFPPRPEGCEHRRAVALVRRMLPDDRPYRLLASRAASYLLLARRPARGALTMAALARSAATGPRPFAELVAATEPEYVLLNDDLLAWEASYPGIEAELASPRWRAPEDPAWLERAER